MTASYEQALVDNELIDVVARLMREIQVDEDSLAFDSIKRVGIGGNFLAQPHTLKNLRKELLVSSVLDRTKRKAWESAGSKDLAIRARERAREILKDHTPEPLYKGLTQALQAIVDRARKNVLK